MDVDSEKWTVGKLKNELERLGARKTRRKADLIKGKVCLCE